MNWIDRIILSYIALLFIVGIANWEIWDNYYFYSWSDYEAIIQSLLEF